jgi:hypothetical protein
LQVIDQNGSPMVQESFYNTATQQTTVSPYLISPSEQTMLENGRRHNGRQFQPARRRPDVVHKSPAADVS